MTFLKYKVIIVGDSVGKKCFFKKIILDLYSEKSISTFGMDVLTLSFTIKNQEGNDLEIDVELWDTSGTEGFRTIAKPYFRSSKGILLMYDITNRESFDNIQKWLEYIKELLGTEEKYLIILIGNKVDLVKSDPNSRAVSIEEAENICKQNNIFWGGEYSVKDISIEQFKDIFKSYIQEIYNKVGVNIPNPKIVLAKPNKPKKYKC